ncbi:hypothetical protein WOLCODRAFT_23387 [Wolfiporia cocos MD-104 SS10]|uniref:Uncharacterized protein n=1 Tax=Wolfiporia cocos (strain MD-104) TaxID=742152 RepID=A0A2H3JL50_WOLCO|nr:hypothetical protein WOLCODRAFT_23387 [Wolfiporia cocos MD-104 SS10]
MTPHETAKPCRESIQTQRVHIRQRVIAATIELACASRCSEPASHPTDDNEGSL